jgi:DNA (cytosine-5)-methyltransferase 1
MAIFGGIGGFELGLARHGHRTSLFCEIDPEAAAVLSWRFSGVPISSDIRRTADLAAMVSSKSNLLTAGFPCTDLSQAGLTTGFAGGRSSLIRDVVKLLKLRPFPHVLIENVPNWRHLHRGKYFAEVIDALERLGYRWAYRTVDAHAFGLPQRRLRLFLYASLEDAPWQTLLAGDARIPVRRYALTKAAHGFYWTEGNRGLGWGEDCIPTLKGGSAVAIPSPPAIVMPDLSIVTPDIADAERLQGFPAHWTSLEEVPVRTFNDRKRWQLVGNAVNVEVSAWIGKQLGSPSQNFLPKKSQPLHKGDPWPSAAWYDGHRCWTASIGTWPIDERRHSLAKFLRFPTRDLSLRATEGFSKRLLNSTLKVKPEFKTALARHIANLRDAKSTSRTAVTRLSYRAQHSEDKPSTMSQSTAKASASGRPS